MVDREKEDLVNARRKLKLFREEQESGKNNLLPNFSSQINENELQRSMKEGNSSRDDPCLVHHGHLPLNEICEDQLTFPIFDLQKSIRSAMERRKDEEMRKSSSKPISFSPLDDEKVLRDKVAPHLSHLQQQFEINVQTIALLLEEKRDLTAKLNQAMKQLERKQGEIDEFNGRLKASRERIADLEKDLLHSTSNIEKRQFNVKEAEKENDRLKLENIRLSQLIEDLKRSDQRSNQSFQQTIQDKDQHIEQLQSMIEKIRQEDKFNVDKKRCEFNRLIEENPKENENCFIETIRREKSDLENEIRQWKFQCEQLKSQLNLFLQDKNNLEKLINEKDQLIKAHLFPQIKENNLKTTEEKEINTDESLSFDSSHSSIEELKRENEILRNRVEQLDEIILQLQSETETIGDYIRLYQQQREQLQKRYEEKDFFIEQIQKGKIRFQKDLAEFEAILIELFQIPMFNCPSNLQNEGKLDDFYPQFNERIRTFLFNLIEQIRSNSQLKSRREEENKSHRGTQNHLYLCSTCQGLPTQI